VSGALIGYRKVNYVIGGDIRNFQRGQALLPSRLGVPATIFEAGRLRILNRRAVCDMKDSDIDKFRDQTAGAYDLISWVSHNHRATHGAGQAARAEEFGMS